MKIAIIGGGAAGFFAAITSATSPEAEVVILERGKSVLQKVRVSGGGRCNVTHACFEARELIQHYPRGSRELLGPFLRFGPQDTVDWFARRGVRLKTEADGRMFPVTDDSQTIVSCLLDAAKNAGVQVRTGVRVEKLEPRSGGWVVHLAGKETLLADRVLVASGSNPAVWEMLAGLGLQIVAPVPSLFTFNIKDQRLHELAGISVPQATLAMPGSKLTSPGPLLITHWGLSGPAVLRLSAWGAHELHRQNYHFPLTVNWLGEKTTGEVLAELLDLKQELARKQIGTYAQFDLPLRLWSRLLAAAEISEGLRWADAGKKQLQKLAAELTAGQFTVHGKSTFKEEFVTAGGVALQEMNFKTFESKRFPGLFFAGEVLDIDAITGGFNFQAAWTGGWIAGSHMATPK